MGHDLPENNSVKKKIFNVANSLMPSINRGSPGDKLIKFVLPALIQFLCLTLATHD
jgi:hypothetical protein